MKKRFVLGASLVVVLTVISVAVSHLTRPPQASAVAAPPQAGADAMRGMPCHMMGGHIMGDCSPEEIAAFQRQAQQTAPASEVAETFLPGSGLAVLAAQPSATLSLEDGARVALEARAVSRRVRGADLTLYGYNGQIPGPSLRVEQNATVYVDFKNSIDLETTVHWHGVRLENKFDGVPHITQAPVSPGGGFLYKLRFPDEGIYWYHPHVREDIQQDSGLYGTILVTPKAKGYYNPVNREEVLVLDDLRLDSNGVVPYGKARANHALMGRFGNVMLVNGVEHYELVLRKGELVRFYIANVANARPFNISFDGAKTKLVGSDLGNHERETFVDSILITPAERYIAEVLFDEAKEYKLQHVGPEKHYPLGVIKVSSARVEPDHSQAFGVLRTNETVRSSIDRYRRHFSRSVDHQLDIRVEVSGMAMAHGKGHGGHGIAAMEWEDDMGEGNANATGDAVRWILHDKGSQKENMDIRYAFRVGDVVKFRLFNDPHSPHPMQHPIHFHGQRFLVLEQDGVRNDRLVWKDTVNVPAGSYVDILLEVSNPGEWMLHCHIPEHMESGMMAMMNVRR